MVWSGQCCIPFLFTSFLVMLPFVIVCFMLVYFNLLDIYTLLWFRLLWMIITCVFLYYLYSYALYLFVCTGSLTTAIHSLFGINSYLREIKKIAVNYKLLTYILYSQSISEWLSEMTHAWHCAMANDDNQKRSEKKWNTTLTRPDHKLQTV